MEDVQAIILHVVIFLAIAQLSYTAPQDAGNILKKRESSSHLTEEKRNNAINHLIEKRNSQVFAIPPMFVQNCNQIYNLDIGDSAVFFSEDGIERRRCRYRFKSPPGTRMAVQCPQFTLPLGCKKEKIIFNQKNYKKLEFCGDKRPEGVVSSGNELSVIYFKKTVKKSVRMAQAPITHFACTTQVLGGFSTATTTSTTLTTTKPTTTTTTTTPTTTPTTTTTTPPTTTTTATTTTTTTTTSTTTTSTTPATTTSTSTTPLSTSSPTTTSTPDNSTDAPSGWFYMEGDHAGWYYESWGQFPDLGASVAPSPGWFHHSGENPGWYWDGWGQSGWNETIDWNNPTWKWNNNRRISPQSTLPTLKTTTSITQYDFSPSLSPAMQSSESRVSGTSWGQWVFVTGTPGTGVKGGWSWVGTGTPKPTSPRD